MKTTPTLSFIITSMRTIINKKTHIEAGLFQLILEIIEMNRKVSLQVGVAQVWIKHQQKFNVEHS